MRLPVRTRNLIRPVRQKPRIQRGPVLDPSSACARCPRRKSSFCSGSRDWTKFDGQMILWRVLRNGERVTAEAQRMAVFQYEATKNIPEEYTESGTIVAKAKAEATAKLNQYGFSEVRLRRIRGIAALWKRFTADIK